MQIYKLNTKKNRDYIYYPTQTIQLINIEGKVSVSDFVEWVALEMQGFVVQQLYVIFCCRVWWKSRFKFSSQVSVDATIGMARSKPQRQSVIRVVPWELLHNDPRAANLVEFDVGIPNCSHQRTNQQSILGDVQSPISTFYLAIQHSNKDVLVIWFRRVVDYKNSRNFTYNHSTYDAFRISSLMGICSWKSYGNGLNMLMITLKLWKSTWKNKQNWWLKALLAMLDIGGKGFKIKGILWHTIN